MYKTVSHLNHNGKDPANAQGHRKMHIPESVETNVTLKQKGHSAINRTTDGDLIFQKESPHRRIIPGASIERKGRRG